MFNNKDYRQYLGSAGTPMQRLLPQRRIYKYQQNYKNCHKKSNHFYLNAINCYITNIKFNKKSIYTPRILLSPSEQYY